MEVDAMTPARRAAVLLHSMNAPDREWIMNSLPSPQRGVLDGLLTELRELGIPSDPELLEEFLKTEPVTAKDVVLREPDQNVIALIAQMLEREPPVLVGRLFAAHEWSWREKVLQQMDPRSAARVRSFSEVPCGAELANFLVKSFERRLEATVSTSEIPVLTKPRRRSTLWLERMGKGRNHG